MQHILEIAAFTLHGAIEAQLAGADRIELCENAADGGTTPSFGFLKQAKENLHIPVFPIIRPRGGDFTYSKEEFEIIKSDIQLCHDLGFEGVVIGMLDRNGNVDISQMKEAIRLCGAMQVTFHRAFDRCHNPSVALEQLIDHGVHRILTSGQHPKVSEGLPQLVKYVVQANQRIIIMPGSGLTSKNVAHIAKNTLASEFHTAARKSISNLFISPDTMNENLTLVSVDKEEVLAIKKELAAL